MVSVNTEKVYQDFNEDESKREFLFLEDRNKLIDERTQNISNIAKNVQELAQCFQDLSHLITYQVKKKNHFKKHLFFFFSIRELF